MKAYNNSRGPVSLGLSSIQLQIKTLLEECGGEAAFEFLDILSELPGRHRQQQLLAMFSAIVERIVASKLPEEWDALFCHELEEDLFNDIMAFMEESEREAQSQNKNDEPLILSLEDYRKAREQQELDSAS